MIELGVPTSAARYSDYTDIGQLVVDIAHELGCAMVAAPTIRSHSPAASGVNPCVVATFHSLPSFVRAIQSVPLRLHAMKHFTRQSQPLEKLTFEVVDLESLNME